MQGGMPVQQPAAQGFGAPPQGFGPPQQAFGAPPQQPAMQPPTQAKSPPQQAQASDGRNPGYGQQSNPLQDVLALQQELGNGINQLTGAVQAIHAAINGIQSHQAATQNALMLNVQIIAKFMEFAWSQPRATVLEVIKASLNANEIGQLSQLLGELPG